MKREEIELLPYPLNVIELSRKLILDEHCKTGLYPHLDMQSLTALRRNSPSSKEFTDYASKALTPSHYFMLIQRFKNKLPTSTIAKTMDISESYVNKQVYQIEAKFKTRNAAEALFRSYLTNKGNIKKGGMMRYRETDPLKILRDFPVDNNLYCQRWDALMTVFFKEVDENMSIRDFISTSPNKLKTIKNIGAVRVMIILHEFERYGFDYATTHGYESLEEMILDVYGKELRLIDIFNL